MSIYLSNPHPDTKIYDGYLGPIARRNLQREIRLRYPMSKVSIVHAPGPVGFFRRGGVHIIDSSPIPRLQSNFYSYALQSSVNEVPKAIIGQDFIEQGRLGNITTFALIAANNFMRFMLEN